MSRGCTKVATVYFLKSEHFDAILFGQHFGNIYSSGVVQRYIFTMNRRKFIISSSLLLGAAGLGALYWKRRWQYIVIHHSAGSSGNIKILQQVHRQRQANDPVDAIPYHFIIGNGNGLALGEIASDWRRFYDIWGAHVSNKNLDRNFRGIGICLIGNLEKTEPPLEQYSALVSLTKKLMSEYGIFPDNVTGHGMTPGESTKCPGEKFPMDKFMRDIT
jgi:N-acetylmuramoyl-L-alanine amidase